MNLFISWSGERSKQIAELLNEWIKCVLQAVDPWISSQDIERGSMWFSEITNQLSNIQHGIVCLTKFNINNPWILFEAGALAKGLTSNRVFTLLVDMQPSEVKDPLAQFNHTLPNKEGVFQLIRTINNGLGESALKDHIIRNVFETYWPQFERKFKEILTKTPNEDIYIERPEEDLLLEILNSVRAIDRRLRKVEDIDFKVNNKNLKNLNIDFDYTTNFAEMPIESLNINPNLIKIAKNYGINYVKDVNLQNLHTIGNPVIQKELIDALSKYIITVTA